MILPIPTEMINSLNLIFQLCFTCHIIIIFWFYVLLGVIFLM